MNHHQFRLLGLIAVGLLLVAAGCSKEEKKAGCAKDTDCKGERVCKKSKCVDPHEAEKSATDKAQTRLTSFLKPISPPKAKPKPPGSAGPATPPGSGTSQIQICVDNKCTDLSGGFRDPQVMRKLLDVFWQLGTGPMGLGRRRGAGPTPKIKICFNGQCIPLDQSLLSDPGALFQKLFQLGPRLKGLFGPNHPFGGQGGRRYQRGIPRSPGAGPTPKGGVTYRDFDDLTRAGAGAVGQLAELKNLSITSVTETRLVLDGSQGRMIVLAIPASLKDEVPRLRITTARITVRFRVTSPPVGKIVRGELVAAN